MIELVFSNDHTPLDLLLWNYFKRQYPGLVERTLAANPGLAALGVFPPRGTKVRVPNPRTASRAPAATVSLWTDGS